jgi:hypothetical protein
MSRKKIKKFLVYCFVVSVNFSGVVRRRLEKKIVIIITLLVNTMSNRGKIAKEK